MICRMNDNKPLLLIILMILKRIIDFDFLLFNNCRGLIESLTMILSTVVESLLQVERLVIGIVILICVDLMLYYS